MAKIKSSVKTANISDPTTPTLKHKDPESVILLQQSAGSQENNIASRQVSPSTSVADIYSSESVKANDIRHSPVANPHK